MMATVVHLRSGNEKKKKYYNAKLSQSNYHELMNWSQVCLGSLVCHYYYLVKESLASSSILQHHSSYCSTALKTLCPSGLQIEVANVTLNKNAEAVKL